MAHEPSVDFDWDAVESSHIAAASDNADMVVVKELLRWIVDVDCDSSQPDKAAAIGNRCVALAIVLKASPNTASPKLAAKAFGYTRRWYEMQVREIKKSWLKSKDKRNLNPLQEVSKKHE